MLLKIFNFYIIIIIIIIIMNIINSNLKMHFYKETTDLPNSQIAFTNVNE